LCIGEKIISKMFILVVGTIPQQILPVVMGFHVADLL
jgi:hypothetical protein